MKRSLLPLLATFTFAGGRPFQRDLASGCRVLAAYFPQGRAKRPFFQVCIDEVIVAGDVPFALIHERVDNLPMT
jgi:hypothetical protein